MPIARSRFVRDTASTRESATCCCIEGRCYSSSVTKNEAWRTFSAASPYGARQAALHARTEYDDAGRIPAPRESARAARTSLGEAERLAETTEEKDQLAEIIRLRGRIWQSDGHHEKARLCFERAIARSRDQRARLFELHAARDLVRLSAEAGGSTEALERSAQHRGLVSAGPRCSCSRRMPCTAATDRLRSRMPRNTRDVPSL